MSDIYAVKEKMHKMRAKLYPSYLPGTEGKFIARTANEASVNIEEICAAAKNRGGYDPRVEANKGIKQTANMPSAMKATRNW